MIATGHTATGVIIGLGAYHFLGQGNPASGLVITGASGAVIHYLMDALPHGHFFMPRDFKKYIKPVIFFDVLLPIILFLGVFYLRNGLNIRLFYILFGMAGSQLPDIVDGLVYTRKIRVKGLLKAENDLHQRVHWHGLGSKLLLLGLRDIWQVFVILAAIILIIK